ncbi:unnamed protein product [Trifolium pratense]|uniref:Uncharacterized protein n=1 Tax=Trifolium pratense TaxID=57577 RepID=A0ACB0JMT2_TRIPR|nr:unnamed protein product [Trifolium pratense]
MIRKAITRERIEDDKRDIYNKYEGIYHILSTTTNHIVSPLAQRRDFLVQ